MNWKHELETKCNLEKIIGAGGPFAVMANGDRNKFKVRHEKYGLIGESESIIGAWKEGARTLQFLEKIIIGFDMEYWICRSCKQPCIALLSKGSDKKFMDAHFCPVEPGGDVVDMDWVRL